MGDFIMTIEDDDTSNTNIVQESDEEDIKMSKVAFDASDNFIPMKATKKSKKSSTKASAKDTQPQKGGSKKATANPTTATTKSKNNVADASKETSKQAETKKQKQKNKNKNKKNAVSTNVEEKDTNEEAENDNSDVDMDMNGAHSNTTAVEATPEPESADAASESDEEEGDGENDGSESEGEGGSESEEEDETSNETRVKKQKTENHEFVNTKLSFADLNLSRPLLRAIHEAGWLHPTPIQAKTIPLAISGQDICGSAVTGSGKTAAFVLPILERLLYRSKSASATTVLILTPTRELAAQCHETINKLTKYTDIRACLVVGGLSTQTQEAELRRRPDIIIATPGRILDHLMNSHSVSLDDLEFLIMDEADRLLELGFSDEVNEILKHCPRKRQTLLFSATMSDDVTRLASKSLKYPVKIDVDPLFQVAHTLTQEFIRVRSEDLREAMLLALCSRTFTSNAIIFCREKRKAHRIKLVMECNNFKVAELHGNMSQTQRLEALEIFKEGKVDFLVCTDVAARGLDIQGIKTVINYELPRTLTNYVHRVGRTARAGRGGRAVSLSGEENRKLMKEVVKHAKGQVKQRVIPKEAIEDWAQKIEESEGQVAYKVAEEKIEKQMRVAEMERNRVENMLVHEEEIYSRPKKSWFQTKDDKEKAKLAAHPEKKALEKLKQEKQKKEQAADGAAPENKRDIHRKRKREEAEKMRKLPRKKRRELQLHDDSDISDRVKTQQISAKQAKKEIKQTGKVPRPEKEKRKLAGPKRTTGGHFDKEETSAVKVNKKIPMKKTGFKSKAKFKRR